MRQNVGELEPDYFQFVRDSPSARSDPNEDMEDQFAENITPKNFRTQGGGIAFPVDSDRNDRNTPKGSKGQGFARTQSLTSEH